MDYDKEDEKPNDSALVSWVSDHLELWRTWRDTNYQDIWEEYERLWRGIWSAEDRSRDTERSRIVTPALQQAIETRHAEIMEAITGQGEWFDISDDVLDQEPGDIEQIKKRLSEDFKKDKIVKAFDQIELLAEIYGTGIGEIIVKTETEMIPMTQSTPVAEGYYQTGIQEKDRFAVKLIPVNPKNFLIDPNATSIDEALGVAIEKYVPIHVVAQKMESGDYRKCDIGTDAHTDELEPTQEQTQYHDGKVRLITYYGLVPKALLDKDKTEEFIDLFDEAEVENYTDLVEAIVVIANGSHLLKAEENPYMMRDRPVIAYQDDTVPNRFYGRGTAEKGYNMQKLIDAQWRAWLDSLALTTSPMIAMDSTRLPRGAKFEVKPGKAILTNGAPQEILYPFNFGQTDPNNLNASKEGERLMLMATGTVDSAGIPSNMPRDAQAGGMSMAMAGILKKYKRTIRNFQEDFLIPFVYKAAWRYMQFAPERYPMVDLQFTPTASLGIMAREYEQSQLIGLMQTLGPESKITPVLLKAVVQHSGLQNREELSAQLDQMSQPDPQTQQMAMMQQQKQLELLQAQIDQIKSQGMKNMAQAQESQVNVQIAPTIAQAKLIAATTNNLPEDPQDKEFERRLKLADIALKEKDIESNLTITKMQTRAKQKNLDNP